MRALVTGGSGFIGRALVASLRERGDEVAVISRRAGAGTVGWDDVEHEVGRADAVVHLSGESIADGRWAPARMRAIRESRVSTTERVARAIAAAALRPRVFVSASAVGIYGMRRDDRPLDEETAPGDDFLAQVCQAWEAAAEPARQAGVRVAHPRTGVVLGRGGGALAKMATPFRWLVGGPIGSGKQWVSWVHLRDVVRALLFAIDTSSLSGPFNLVAPEAVPMERLAKAIAAALHRPDVVRVPALALKLALGPGLAETLLSGQRAVPRRLVDAGFAFEFPEVERACADLLGAHVRA